MLKTTTLKQVTRFGAFLRAIFEDFIALDGSVKAAALAYATLIAIVPLMVFSFGFVLAFPTMSPYFEALHQFLFRHFIPSSASIIQKNVQLFASNATNLSATGLVFFLITAVLLIFTMETVFNSIWHVKTTRKGIRAFLNYWAFLTLIPPMGVVAVALSVFLTSLPIVSTLFAILAYFLPFVLTFCGYAFIYATIPNCQVLIRHASIGALVAAVLFEIVKEGFRLYATNFSSDVIVYGVLSVIPMFLLWLYLSWLITIIGAVIAHRLGQSRRRLP